MGRLGPGYVWSVGDDDWEAGGEGGGLEASSTGSSGVLLGTAKGLMASYHQATNKIKKFLETQLPITVHIQFPHHVVKDSGVLLVLCEGNQFCIHEGQELRLGKYRAVTVLSNMPPENSRHSVSVRLDIFALSE